VFATLLEKGEIKIALSGITYINTFVKISQLIKNMKIGHVDSRLKWKFKIYLKQDEQVNTSYVEIYI
jgi:hypothetical protein